MAHAVKPRTIADWAKRGEIPAVRPGASVLVFEVGSGFGSPSDHPCGLEDPLSPRKTTVCWNDARAKWTAQTNFQPAADELLLEFSVEAAAFGGRCHGVFFSRSRMQYVAALHADVLRLAPATKSDTERRAVLRRARKLQRTVATPAAQRTLAEVESEYRLAAERTKIAQNTLLRLRNEMKRISLRPKIQAALAKGNAFQTLSAKMIERILEHQLNRGDFWAPSDEPAARELLRLAKLAEEAAEKFDEADDSLAMLEQQRTQLLRRQGEVDLARDAAFRSRSSSGALRRLRTEQLRAEAERLRVERSPRALYTRPESTGEGVRTLADMSFSAMQPFDPVQPAYDAPVGEKSLIPSAARTEAAFEVEKKTRLEAVAAAEQALQIPRDELFSYMKLRGIQALPSARTPEGLVEMVRLKALHGELRRLLDAVVKAQEKVQITREKLQALVGADIKIPARTTSADYTLSKVMAHTGERMEAKAKRLAKESAEKLAELEAAKAREMREERALRASAEAAKLRAQRAEQFTGEKKARKKRQLDGLRGMTQLTGRRRLWER